MMKIIVLAGGYSTERNVSFTSGANVANALIKNGHEVMLLDVYLGIKNTEFPAEYTKTRQYQYSINENEPDLNTLRNTAGTDDLIGQGVIELCQQADVVFLTLHGSYGENGQLQALFDLYNITYTGSGYIGCLLSMDKDLAKKMMKYDGVPTPPWITVRKGEYFDSKNITYPCFVKPCMSGSSIGISLVKNETELNIAVDVAFKYDDKIIIEEKISGRELCIGVLDGKALPIIEINLRTGFFDFSTKYKPGFVEEVCPAPIEQEITERLQKAAVSAHKALNLGLYSRSDFILTEDGSFYCLEVNALPGMTSTSTFPQEAAAIGINYNDLCEKICLAALRNLK